MQDYKIFFKNKKITIMGLGLLGRGIGIAKFLAEIGAILTITDLKSRSELISSLKELRKYKNIQYTLGKHNLKDFKDKDMIIKAAGVPLDSMYIKEAEKNGIPIEMDASLFTKFATGVKIIGVTGTRGKSMTTQLIYEILSKSKKYKNKTYIGGNVRGLATLPLLKKVKMGDAVVFELDSWQLQGFGDSRISPYISVFTSFMTDHINYYLPADRQVVHAMKKYFTDKANIFKYQNENDFLIIRPDVKKLIKSNKAKMIVVNKKDVEKYDFIVPGEHQRENLACAVEVAQILGIPEDEIKKAVKNFKGLEGRLQYVKSINGVKIYNDNNATTPEATIAGLAALNLGVQPPKRIILICGGADKGLKLDNLVKAINKYCKAVIVIPGTGTDKLVSSSKVLVASKYVKNLNDAIKTALGLASRGDIILFSPAFASFGQFNNEYERNDLFMKIVKNLK